MLESFIYEGKTYKYITEYDVYNTATTIDGKEYVFKYRSQSHELAALAPYVPKGSDDSVIAITTEYCDDYVEKLRKSKTLLRLQHVITITAYCKMPVYRYFKETDHFDYVEITLEEYVDAMEKRT
jgi:hypothetical protein